MKKFIKANWPAILIFVLLFIIPSFWFDKGKVDYGGDSNRIYFYDSLSWLKNIALYLINPLSGLGRDMPNFFMIPFLLFLSFLKTFFFHSGFSLNNFFNGLLLSGGFFSVYLIVKEILRSEIDHEEKISYPAIISGLFFILSPLLVFQWERSLYSIGYLFIYPFAFLLFLKFLHTKKFFYITLIPMFCLFFSVNFSYATMPWLFAFFLPGFLFLLLYSIILKKTKFFIRGFVIFCILMVMVMSFDYIIQTYNLISPFGLSNRMLFDKEITTNRSLAYFLSVQPHVRLIYNLLNQDQYVITSGTGSPFVNMLFNFGVKFLPVFIIYPLILGFGAILSKMKLSPVRQKMYFLILVTFLVMLFFMTANITNLGVSFYKSLFHLPPFGMFRSFYSKFAMVYVFFYSLILGYSLFIVFEFIKSSTRKKLLWFFLFFLIIFNGWPLLSGKMAKGTLWRSRDIPYANEIDPVYQKFLNRLKEEKPIFKVWSFPFANEDYQILQGKTGGVYFGPSTIPILTGKNAFSGQTGFGHFWPYLQNFIESGQFSEAKRLLSFLNIGYVFYNSDEYIYNNFPNYPYSGWLRQSYTTQKMIGKLVEDFDFLKIYSVGNYNLYRLDDEYLLPLFYVPRKIVSSKNGIEVFPEALSMGGIEARTGFFLNSLSDDRQPSDNFYIYGKNKDIENLETKYRVKNSGVIYPLVVKKKSRFWLFQIIQDRLDKIGFGQKKDSIFSGKLLKANTAINKMASFKTNENTHLEVYKRNIAEAMELLNEKKTSVDKTEQVFALKNNIEDNLARLTGDKSVNYSDWRETIEKFLSGIGSFLPNYNVSQREYFLDVTKSSQYTFFVAGQTSSLTTTLMNSLNGCSLGIVDDISRKDLVVLNPVRNENGWLNLGDFNLIQGSKKITLDFCKLQNLLGENDWKVFKTLPKKEEINRPVKIEGYQLPFSQKYYYKDITKWEPNTWYEFKVRLKGNSKVRITIGEERNRWTVAHKKVKLLKQFDITNVFEIDPSLDGTDFNFEIKSSSDIFSAKIFVYSVDDGTNREDYILEVEKASILPVLEPRVILKSVDQGNQTPVEVPEITFSKINPTKYKINVKNAEGPYTLIFSQYFHPEWKIYLNSKQELSLQNIRQGVLGKLGAILEKAVANFWKDGGSNVITAEYFNGEIKEGSHKSTFLEPSTFETWGKQPIAESNHLLVNGYANSWYIKPSDVGGKKDYELVVEFVPQRTLYVGILISSLTLLGCILFSVVNFVFTRNSKNDREN